MITEEEKQFFKDNFDPAYKMSESEEFKSFTKEEQLKILLSELEKKQGIELTNLLQSDDYSISKETILKNRHSKQRDKLYSKFYKEDTTSKIERIQAKKNITVKEYTQIYNDSAKAQQNDRGRIKNPLPFHQKIEGGKITYTVEEVEEWREKYNFR